MGQPAAKQNDRVIGVDTHIVLVPVGPALVPTPLPHPYTGALDAALSSTVKIQGQPAALVDSTSTNQPAHIPTPPGVMFQKPPTNRGRVVMGSTTVLVDGKPLARAGDPVASCNDPADVPVSKIVAAGTVLIGG